MNFRNIKGTVLLLWCNTVTSDIFYKYCSHVAIILLLNLQGN